MDEYAATLMVHTPSGPVPACAKHAQAIIGLMRFLGTHTVAEPHYGEQCANCVNEAKKAEP